MDNEKVGSESQVSESQRFTSEGEMDDFEEEPKFQDEGESAQLLERSREGAAKDGDDSFLAYRDTTGM